MRDVFADRYNFVTIQYAYFGDQFMQGAESFLVHHIEGYAKKYFNSEEYQSYQGNPSQFINILSSKSIILPVIAKMKEELDIFNAMGFMQAIDLITAIEADRIILRENGLFANENKIIGYGQSHGAFLLHLVNRLAPH